MRRFLQNIRIGSYGSVRDREVGPLGPGLNVVFGPNEAGKSTVASFVGGVLFGWEEARGVRNTYRPVDGHRFGSLEFAPAGAVEGEATRFDAVDAGAGDSQQGGFAIVSREHNADGLRGDASIVADIDNATYRTMFWLTSDELRSLRNTSDVTARLLAAGSATGSSPAAAYVQVEQRIAALTAPTGDESIQALGLELDAVRDQISSATEQVSLLKQQDRERMELVESRASAAARIDEINARIATLYDCRARLESIDAQLQANEVEMSRLEEERVAVLADDSLESGGAGHLVDLDAAMERTLRGELDDYADEQEKLARSVDLARENAAASSAAYEALLEVDAGAAAKAPGLGNRKLQAVVSVLLPIAFAAIGVLVFVYGRQTRSLSLTLLAAGVMVAAFVLAAGAVAVFLRPNKGAEVLEERRKDAQWVMLQDQKKLESSLRAKQAHDEEIADFLNQRGLSDAGGSIRQARSLLDEAHEARSRLNLVRQRESALAMRMESAQKAHAALLAERRTLESGADVPDGASVQQIDALLREATSQRDALAAAYDDMNLRYGELDQRLNAMRSDRSLDDMKLRYQQGRCRLRESKYELVSLLLAKRMLEQSIAAWESRSQPEVYAKASRLLSLMTDGAWERMRMTAEGRLVAVSGDGEVREVRHLSLGTCQQLYLSLRVAMLLHASSVGRSIPVIADDILVNFDAARRSASARVLAELAQARQVIVFTCHRQTVDALREADPSLTYIEL